MTEHTEPSLTKENKMGTMPIPKLLFSISLPMIISMLIQALYNIVDSIFVAKLGENALTAVSLTFPIQNLIIAVAVGTAIGVNALISKYLGAKRNEDANTIAKNGIFLSFINYILFAIIGIFGSYFFFRVQTDNQQIVEYGTQYMFIVCTFSIGIFLQITMERLLQSTGKTIYNMYAQGAGAIINIILDPILIFGLFGLPAMNVIGAAVATIIGQFASASLGLFFVLKYNKELNINMRRFRPDFTAIKEIYKIGFPAIMMQSVGSIMVFAMNYILLMFSTTAAAVFGIYFKVQSFIFMPVFGLTNGMVSIVAYNYGARNKKRILQTFRMSCYTTTTFMALGFLAFQLIPGVLLRMFDASPEMLEIGIVALRVISCSFLLAGICIVCSSMFQALGNAVYSLITSVARQLAVLIPVAYLLAYYGGLHMVWFAFPIAEVVCLVTSIFFMRRMYRTTIEPLD